MALYTMVTDAITQYTGLSPAAFFTISAMMLVAYKVVTGMFVAADDYMAVKRQHNIAIREPVQIGSITEEELRPYDGSHPNKPLLMAIKGNIYDVSRSRSQLNLILLLYLFYSFQYFRLHLLEKPINGVMGWLEMKYCLEEEMVPTIGDGLRATPIRLFLATINFKTPYLIVVDIMFNKCFRMFYGPGGPYALFAGRDASRALALMSFEPSDLTGNIEGLGSSELEVLEDWEAKFEEKYVKVGQLVSEKTSNDDNKLHEDQIKED
ncbi:hypothetical protein OSB04_024086 [Centaurea solstitialis]|uniref:Cytochrome b5 heme-binding domain-containing protein n=1 Tax=Centaurea solstitialis TaxID=347529 RepID=A0AA38SKF3_9ASTR|nr:hypothetical protein OSB04_024086 [Centaurea solstitialis]